MPTHSIYKRSPLNDSAVALSNLHEAVPQIGRRQAVTKTHQPATQPFRAFSLVLMVNHACNLRCNYCYTGAKAHRPMRLVTGDAAIDRAVASLDTGGTLELGFFGGEPLIEASHILEWMHHARRICEPKGIDLRFNLTTNGTIQSPAAWQVMLAQDMELSVSCDGHPARHDRHRVRADGSGSSQEVLAGMRWLQNAGKEFQVVTVVRPDTLRELPESFVYLHALGAKQISLSLDLWCPWISSDVALLESVIAECADLWAAWIPNFSVNWFDEKAARMANLQVVSDTARCGFGVGEIAVAPSGRLYPCERLIGEDREGQPMQLGHVLDASDFLQITPSPARTDDPCSAYQIQSICSTTCRCSNYVRTGDVSRPDGLLWRLDKACFRETHRVLAQDFPNVPTKPQPPSPHHVH